MPLLEEQRVFPLVQGVARAVPDPVAHLVPYEHTERHHEEQGREVQVPGRRKDTRRHEKRVTSRKKPTKSPVSVNMMAQIRAVPPIRRDRAHQ